METHRDRRQGDRPRDENAVPASATVELTLAVVDIVGSTELARDVGDVIYADVLEDFRAETRHCAGQCDGREFAQTGDGFIHCYDSPTAALSGMASIFQRNELANPHRSRPLVIRAGIHHGNLVRSVSGLIGLALNDACELANAATADGLWLSHQAYAAIGDRAGHLAGTLVDFPKSGPRIIHKVGWREIVRNADGCNLSVGQPAARLAAPAALGWLRPREQSTP